MNNTNRPLVGLAKEAYIGPPKGARSVSFEGSELRQPRSHWEWDELVARLSRRSQAAILKQIKRKLRRELIDSL
jgi:signal recognition particle subunit SEC65